MTSAPSSPGIDGADRFADECHFFALALQAVAGGDLAFVANRAPDGSQREGHVVVTLGPGVHADAEGVWAEADLLAAWSSTDVVPTTKAEIARSFAGGRITAHGRERIGQAEAAIRADAGFRERVGAAMDAPGPAPRP